MTFIDVDNGGQRVSIVNDGDTGLLAIIVPPDDPYHVTALTARLNRHEAMVLSQNIRDVAEALPTGDGYVANGPICGCCGKPTIPPTPGTDEEGFYCDSCGFAMIDPTQQQRPCMLHKMAQT